MVVSRDMQVLWNQEWKTDLEDRLESQGYSPENSLYDEEFDEEFLTSHLRDTISYIEEQPTFDILNDGDLPGVITSAVVQVQEIYDVGTKAADLEIIGKARKEVKLRNSNKAAGEKLDDVPPYPASNFLMLRISDGYDECWAVLEETFNFQLGFTPLGGKFYLTNVAFDAGAENTLYLNSDNAEYLEGYIEGMEQHDPPRLYTKDDPSLSEDSGRASSVEIMDNIKQLPGPGPANPDADADADGEPQS